MLQNNLYGNDIADSESVDTSVSRANRRRIDAQAKLVESFATFVESVARTNSSNASLSSSSHSYFQTRHLTEERSNQRRLPEEQQSDAVDDPTPFSRSMGRSDHSYFSYGMMNAKSASQCISAQRPGHQRLVTRFDAMKLEKENSSTSFASTDTELTASDGGEDSGNASPCITHRTMSEPSTKAGRVSSSRFGKKKKGHSYMKSTFASTYRRRNR